MEIMKNENWKQIMISVICIFGGFHAGMRITAIHEGRIFPVVIFTMAVGASIMGIIKYLIDKRRGINATTSKFTFTVSLCIMVGLLIGVGAGLIGYQYFQ